MVAIVVPFRGTNGKQRLGPLADDERAGLALAMLGDVLAACIGVGDTVVVTADELAADVSREHGGRLVADPGGGQGRAVAEALRELEGRVLVVNADLPCARPADVHALDGAVPGAGLAYVAAPDGTTNALGLSSPSVFASLYGPGSAERFRRHVRERGLEAVPAAIPNLADDVDSLDDLDRLVPRLGPRTLAARPR